MELKRGYKRTEVGVIPEDWKGTTVGAVASSTRNAIVGGPFGSDLVARDYVPEGVPVIRGQNMGPRWVQGPFVFVSPSKAKSLEANLACPQDIVFTQRGTLGQVSLVPHKPYARYLISQSQMKATLDQGVADPSFFHHLFTGQQLQEAIRQNTIQTGVPHINLGILRQLPVPCPPVWEQRAIATALSDVDALISSLDQLIAKKRDIKQATMQQLLTGKQRLARFKGESDEGSNYKHSELGKIPEDWAVLKLRDLATFRTGPFGSALHTSDYSTNGVPVINPMHIVEGQIVPTDTMSVTEAAAMQLGDFRLKNGEIIIGRRGDMGRCAVVRDRHVGWLCGTGSMIVRCGARAHPDFLQRVLSSAAVVAAIEATSVGSTMINLNQSTLAELSIQTPSFEEQSAIVTVLSDMDAELAALEQKRGKTKALKQGMMQELLTGRIRLV
ncbi:restriction endonuclease subunit S [Paraburkholderia hospita]|uniref:restriction endonuclease subunit S n=1 Tax=Paraburkholderia hospita TaxID=169430 RepID=UPI0009A81748|nr:restriction endonuclease subunit S [Paraburkholderia hospita]SKC49450.1 Restriction endonuclease S subunit [Paraburkholderia hospita]